MKSRLSWKKINLLTIILLFTSALHAVSADFFGTSTTVGETNFRSTITSADASAVLFEYHFTSRTSASALVPVAVTGSDLSTVFVKVSRGNPISPYTFDGYTKNVAHEHDFKPHYYMDDWSVSVSNWNERADWRLAPRSFGRIRRLRTKRFESE